MKTFKALLLGIGAVGFAFLMYALAQNGTVAILEPKGIIAAEEKRLIVLASILMALVVIPVFILTFAIAWRYRASNTQAKYLPNWEHNTLDEAIWWGVPSAIVVFLAILTWNSSHALDPFRPIEGKAPITIQVVALEWKWLFVYPSQGIATVNFVQFPVNTPVEFQITGDAPMNSFWIPQLGGQIYAMQGMRTKLHLLASETGDFSGSSANFSGRGFAGMRFTARASPSADFDAWVASVKRSPGKLDMVGYAALSIPSVNEVPLYYGAVQPGLFDSVISKYMASEHAH